MSSPRSSCRVKSATMIVRLDCGPGADREYSERGVRQHDYNLYVVDQPGERLARRGPRYLGRLESLHDAIGRRAARDDPVVG